MRKNFLAIGAIAATLVAGGWALAEPDVPGFGPPFPQGDGLGGMGPGMMQHRGMGQGMDWDTMRHMHGAVGHGMMHVGLGLAFADPTQIDALKSELGVTAAQEPAWTKYVKTVQDAATALKTARGDVDQDTISKLSPQDRLAFAAKMREQGQKQFETVKTAATDLLATLDDAQKSKAQQILPGLAFGPGAMHWAGVGWPERQR